MAAYVSVPRDLSRVKSKILFNLTRRQLLCFGAAALIGGPSFFVLKASGNVSMAAIGMIIIMLPLFFLGMYERDGMPLEVIARLFIQANLIRPKVRPYQTDNYYAILMRQDQAEKEVNAIVCNVSKKQAAQARGRKAAEKSHQDTGEADS